MSDSEKKGERRFLRLVSDDFLRRELVNSSFQLGLFPKSDPLVLSFFHVGFLKKGGLIKTTTELSPHLFIDVRAVPSFRALDVEREAVLRFLDEYSVSYVDVAGLIGGKRLRLAESSLAVKFISELFSGSALSRPAMLVFDDVQLMGVMADQLIALLRDQLNKDFKAQVFAGKSNSSSLVSS